MTPTSELDRLFRDIPKPDPLGDVEAHHESVEGLFIEDETMTTGTSSPIVVPNYTSSHDANRLYGEAYGVDWVYESSRFTESASAS